LAQRSNGNILPVLKTLHDLKELACRAGSTHIASNVGVELGALLEDADAVMVGTKAIMLVAKRFRDQPIG